MRPSDDDHDTYEDWLERQDDTNYSIGTEAWWGGPPFATRGPVDAILCLLEREEITRRKALEVLASLYAGHLPTLPLDRVVWAEDADVLIPGYGDPNKFIRPLHPRQNHHGDGPCLACEPEHICNAHVDDYNCNLPAGHEGEHQRPGGCAP